MVDPVKNRLLIGIGLLLMLSTVLCNTWTVARIISPDGTIGSGAVTYRIRIVDLFLIVVGGLLIIYRQKISVSPKSLLFATSGFLCMVGGILFNEWILARLLNWYGTSGKIAAWMGEGLLILLGTLLIIYRNTLTMKAIGFRLGGTVVAICLPLWAAELGLRWIGYHPIPDFMPWSVEIEPGGKMYQPHPTLGYRHLAGEFTVTFYDGYSYHATHLANTLRVTHPAITQPANNSRPGIWIFGCSFTYGFGINDQETYPWLLQEQFPQSEIVNFGVSGYGTVQSLIQFQEALQQEQAPRIAILAYAAFHDERNILSRERRNAIASHNRLGLLFQPYARLDSASPDGLRFDMGNIFYHHLLLSHDSAFMALIDQAYSQVQERWWLHGPEVSRQLIRKFATVAQNHGTTFIVAGIDSDEATRAMLAFCDREGISNVAISVDSTLRQYYVTDWDHHPNALANRAYADRLKQFIIENKLL